MVPLATVSVCLLLTGVLAQVDEMLDREEQERRYRALEKELGAIEDDIRLNLTSHQ